MVMNNTSLLFFLRNLRKNKSSQILNITGLALGLGTALLMAMWVWDEYTYDRFHTDPQQLYILTNELGSGWWYDSPPLLTEYLKEDFPEVNMTVRISDENWLIGYGDKQFREACGCVDPSFFRMFRFPVMKGDPDHLLDGRHSVVLSERAARKFFGDEDPLGKSMNVINRGNYVVTGIMENFPENSSLQYDILFPIDDVLQEKIEKGWDLWSYDIRAFIRLLPGTDVDAFRMKMAGTCNRYDPRPGPKTCRNDLQLFSSMRLHSLTGTPRIQYVAILMLTALFILLIASANFINLATATNSIRNREIGVRKVNGATKGLLIRYFLGESILTALIAMGIALLLVWGLLSEINILVGKQLTLSRFFSYPFLLIIVLLPMIIGIFSGIVPAFLLSSMKPVEALGSASTSRSRSGHLRKGLVIAQFVISVVIIICTWITYHQLHFMRERDPGFAKENILVFRNNRSMAANYPAFREEVLRHSQVSGVTWAQSLPFEFSNQNSIRLDAFRGGEEVMIHDNWVGDGYTALFGIPVTEGRDFHPHFRGDSTSCLVNEALVRLLGISDPVGKVLYHFPDDTLKIIGVMKDFHALSMHEEIPPVVILPRLSHHSRYLLVKLNPLADSTALVAIQALWKQFSGNYPWEYTTVNDLFLRQYQTEERISGLLFYVSLISILLALMGLFGLSAFTARQRTREIAIRKVSGATTLSVVGYLSNRFIRLILISNMIAWPVAFLLSRQMLSAYAYKTSVSFWLFALVTLITLFVSFLVILGHTLNAASKNPSETLQYE